MNDNYSPKSMRKRAAAAVMLSSTLALIGFEVASGTAHAQPRVAPAPQLAQQWCVSHPWDWRCYPIDVYSPHHVYWSPHNH
jgi:hypothetical protein